MCGAQGGDSTHVPCAGELWVCMRWRRCSCVRGPCCGAGKQQQICGAVLPVCTGCRMSVLSSKCAMGTTVVTMSGVACGSACAGVLFMSQRL